MNNHNETLSVNELNYSYRDHRVLNNISFSVNEGEVCGLLGPNGSGKTTLLKCMNGILSNGNGHVKVIDKKISSLQREEIAMLMAVVPQELNVVFSYTALQIVIMGGGARFGLTGIPSEKDYLTALDTLKELGMEHLADRRYNELSGGEKQTVLIARALFQKPKILLLDEPTSHLDFKKQHTIMDLIRKITIEKKLTTLVTLHDPNIAGRYCDRLVMLREGKIVYQGLRSKIFNAESLGATYDMKVEIKNTGQGIEYVLPGCDQ
jgi:iron complex transport system ATP-binding protein